MRKTLLAASALALVVGFATAAVANPKIKILGDLTAEDVNLNASVEAGDVIGGAGGPAAAAAAAASGGGGEGCCAAAAAAAPGGDGGDAVCESFNTQIEVISFVEMTSIVTLAPPSDCECGGGWAVETGDIDFSGSPQPFQNASGVWNFAGNTGPGAALNLGSSVAALANFGTIGGP